MPANVPIGTTAELKQILQLLIQLGTQMNAIQSAISALQTAVAALTAAVQANTYGPADVTNVQNLTSQVNALTSSLTTPPAPTPTPTPSPTPTPTPSS